MRNCDQCVAEAVLFITQPENPRGGISLCMVHLREIMDRSRDEILRGRGRIAELEAEVERLRGENERLVKANEGLEEEITDWQCATGLMRGGDPDGVDQKMLAAFINDATSIIGAVRSRTVVHWGTLEALVEKFNQRWPEE